MSCAQTRGWGCLFWHQFSHFPRAPVSASVLCDTSPVTTRGWHMSNGFLVCVKTDSERHKTLHKADILDLLVRDVSCLISLMMIFSPVTVARPRQSTSSPDMAPRPVTSLMITSSLASWRPLIGPEPQYWPLIGQQLVTITQSADMSLTARGENALLVVTRILSH